ncbi:DUF2785 domain-containing protein [Pseudoxanthomonas sp. CF125]|uniref:DUF2785 domain-containing protein n=1 Tax=Pseudoxanthomonas sp. CF125 TaxID=1855303 RepID=UPI000880628D|nr:DUF2785 domain-containing protein [Pseudoxanthomonas sp. CF125]SDR22295.1 Protein of unknown function [Pseudoxanthomonas sp. CF125]
MSTGRVDQGRWLPRALLGFALLLPLSARAEDACPPEGTDAGSLQLLKQQDFKVDDAATRNTLAIRLLGCLSSPDPALRDGIAYEALTAWLRGNGLEADTRVRLRDDLYAMLQAPDTEGFARPFAALVLSEVARTDRIAPWMTPAERVSMVDQATAYLRSVQDYRGFDNAQGWRHGVAHGSDWLMQLALNPALERPQLESMLAAIAAQAVPESAHAYVFGEPGRLARPVLYIAKRGVLADADWSAWFLGLPARIGEREKAYSDTAWLARRHDLLAFLTSVYLEADQSADAPIKALKGPVVLALKTIP